MSDPITLRATAARPPGTPRLEPALAAPPQRVLVAGAGGTLGAAVVEQLVGSVRVPAVGVVVARPLAVATRGLVALADDAAAWLRFAPEAAMIVFDRGRRANGRDDAFLAPAPADLLPLARRLRGCGVRTLVVAVPHAPALLPAALQRGLASLDEGAVAALGFDHLVFMRVAQGPDRSGAAVHALQRLARWLLGQLRWMVPQREQPLRAPEVGRIAALLLVALRTAPAATRILPSEVAWAAARSDAAAVLAAWLAGRPLPQASEPAQRW